MTVFFVPVPGRYLNCSESPKSPNSPNHHAVDDHGNGGGASFLGAATAATHDVPHLHHHWSTCWLEQNGADLALPSSESRLNREPRDAPSEAFWPILEGD